MNAKNAANSTLGRPSALSTNSLGSIASPFSTIWPLSQSFSYLRTFNQADYSINDVLLIPVELISSNRDSVRKAHEAHLIDKAMTPEPQGINRRD